MRVKITMGSGKPPGKLADAEIHFDDGPLQGLKLIGFSIWERRTPGMGMNVTFPARQYSVNGERRSFALLRPIEGDVAASQRLTADIISAYDDAVYQAEHHPAQAGPGEQPAQPVLLSGVRDQERPTPTFDALFSLTREAAPARGVRRPLL